MKKIIVLMILFLFILVYSSNSAVDCDQLEVKELGVSHDICERHNCGGSWWCDIDYIKHSSNGLNCEFYESCMDCTECEFNPESEEINWNNAQHIIEIANSEYRDELLDYLWKMPNLAVLEKVDSNLLNELMKEKFNIDLDIGPDATVHVTEDGHLVSDSLSLDFDLNGISGSPIIELTLDGFNYEGNTITGLDEFGWSTVNFDSSDIKISTGNGVEIKLYSDTETTLSIDNSGLNIEGIGVVYVSDSGFTISSTSSDSKSNFKISENGELLNLRLERAEGTYSVRGTLSDGQIFDFKGQEITVDFVEMDGSLLGSSSSLKIGSTNIIGSDGYFTVFQFGECDISSGGDVVIWVGSNGDVICKGPVEFYDVQNGFKYKGKGDSVMASYNKYSNNISFQNPYKVKDVAEVTSVINGDKGVRVIVTMDENGEYIFWAGEVEISDLSGDTEFSMDQLTITIDNIEFKASSDENGNIRLDVPLGSINIESELNALDSGTLPELPYEFPEVIVEVGASLDEQSVLEAIVQYGCQKAKQLKLVQCCDNYDCPGIDFDTWYALADSYDYCYESGSSCSGRILTKKCFPYQPTYATCMKGICMQWSYKTFYADICRNCEASVQVECCNDEDCSPGFKCAGAGNKGARCEPKQVFECADDIDCGEDQICINNECRFGCRDDNDCRSDRRCMGGICREQEKLSEPATGGGDSAG